MTVADRDHHGDADPTTEARPARIIDVVLPAVAMATADTALDVMIIVTATATAALVAVGSTTMNDATAVRRRVVALPWTTTPLPEAGMRTRTAATTARLLTLT